MSQREIVLSLALIICLISLSHFKLSNNALQERNRILESDNFRLTSDCNRLESSKKSDDEFNARMKQLYGR